MTDRARLSPITYLTNEVILWESLKDISASCRSHWCGILLSLFGLFKPLLKDLNTLPKGPGKFARIPGVEIHVEMSYCMVEQRNQFSQLLMNGEL